MRAVSYSVRNTTAETVDGWFGLFNFRTEPVWFPTALINKG